MRHGIVGYLKGVNPLTQCPYCKNTDTRATHPQPEVEGKQVECFCCTGRFTITREEYHLCDTE